MRRSPRYAAITNLGEVILLLLLLGMIIWLQVFFELILLYNQLKYQASCADPTSLKLREVI